VPIYTGRKPEHSFYPGSGYCGRRCHHPHIHGHVPGGGIAPDGQSWIASGSRFFLQVRVLSRLFRGRFLHYLQRAYDAGKLNFFSAHRHLHELAAFRRYLAPMYQAEWVVYAKRPFAGPAQVLDYVGRYTHRVAISSSRLVSMDNGKVRFRWKDYGDGDRRKTMTLEAGEFIRRFLLHVLPDGSMRQTHVAGERLFVDYAGQTVPITDPLSGEVRQAQVYVAALGASNYTHRTR